VVVLAGPSGSGKSRLELPVLNLDFYRDGSDPLLPETGAADSDDPGS